MERGRLVVVDTARDNTKVRKNSGVAASGNIHGYRRLRYQCADRMAGNSERSIDIEN
jgi:hypothetical protein